MRTKQLLLTIAVFFIAGSAQIFGFSTTNTENSKTLVQPPQGERPKFDSKEVAKRETKWMTTDLNLTDNQIPLVDSINFIYADKMSKLMKPGEGQDRDAMHAKMEEIQKLKTEELKNVLTEDQLKKYVELQPKHRGGGRGGSRPEGAKPEDK